MAVSISPASGRVSGRVKTDGLSYAAAGRLNGFCVWARSTEFETHVI